MFLGLVIVFVGLVAIIWPVAYFIATAGCVLIERKEQKREEARAQEYEARDRRAREAREKIWAERFAQMTQEEYEDFMNCPFT